jgi:hypothetical protein
MPTRNTGVRSRQLGTSVKFSPVRVEKTGVPIQPGSTSQWKGIQKTVSEGHRKTNGRYHEGGPFLTSRIQPSVPTRYVELKGTFGGTKYVYSGPACTPGVPKNLGGFSIPSEDSSYLDQHGATAISRINPTNPNAQTGVALGEIIRDRRLPIPGLQAWKRRTEVAKAAGSEYLNAVFGWLPLVGDMKDTAQSVLDGNLILENYQNASGTFVHREFGFPDVETHEEAVITNAIPDYGPVGVPGLNVVPVPLTKTTHRVVKRWFSGAFTYHANSATNQFARCLGIGSDAEKLFGTTLTPDLIWELTPWSWAVDWFTNAGDVINNVRAFELAGLIMRYGYIMEETTITDTYTLRGTGISGLSGAIPPASYTYCVKRRREANPFGFGVSWDGLSPTQLAITAALGITRLR